MYKTNIFFLTIVWFLLNIDNSKQSHVKSAIKAFKLIGKTINNPFVKNISNTIQKPIIKIFGNTVKDSVAMFRRNKYTIKNTACGLQEKYLRTEHLFGRRSTKYLRDEGIKKFKYMAYQASRGGQQLVRTKSKKNIQMRSAAQMSGKGKYLKSFVSRSAEQIKGKEFKSLINMVSKSKPQLPLIFVTGGLDRLTHLNFKKDETIFPMEIDMNATPSTLNPTKKRQKYREKHRGVKLADTKVTTRKRRILEDRDEEFAPRIEAGLGIKERAIEAFTVRTNSDFVNDGKMEHRGRKERRDDKKAWDDEMSSPIDYEKDTPQELKDHLEGIRRESKNTNKQKHKPPREPRKEREERERKLREERERKMAEAKLNKKIKEKKSDKIEEVETEGESGFAGGDSRYRLDIFNKKTMDYFENLEKKTIVKKSKGEKKKKEITGYQAQYRESKKECGMENEHLLSKPFDDETLEGTKEFGEKKKEKRIKKKKEKISKTKELSDENQEAAKEIVVVKNKEETKDLEMGGLYRDYEINPEGGKNRNYDKKPSIKKSNKNLGQLLKEDFKEQAEKINQTSKETGEKAIKGQFGTKESDNRNEQRVKRFFIKKKQKKMRGKTREYW